MDEEEKPRERIDQVSFNKVSYEDEGEVRTQTQRILKEECRRRSSSMRSAHGLDPDVPVEVNMKRDDVGTMSGSRFENDEG